MYYNFYNIIMKDLLIEIKAGDILHCKSDGFLGRNIQRVTGSIYNHTAFAIEIYGDIYIVDAQRGGIIPRRLDLWLERYDYKIDIHRNKYWTKEDIDSLCVRAMSKSGETPYDFASLFLYQPIYNIFGVWKGKRNEDADSRMYCSEYIGWIVRLPGYYKMSPGVVFDELDLRYEYKFIKAR